MNRFTKKLSAVEARPERSNQHEFNGVSELKRMLRLDEKKLTGKMLLSGTDVSAEVGVTWYDAREAHATRSEHRLYFPPNTVMSHAKEGDVVEFLLINDSEIQITLIPA